MALNPHQKNKVDISVCITIIFSKPRTAPSNPVRTTATHRRRAEALPPLRQTPQQKRPSAKQAQRAQVLRQRRLRHEQSRESRCRARGRIRPPESIPHLSQQQSQTSSQHPGGSVSGGPSLHPTYSQGQAGSPVKEPSVLQRGMSVDEQDSEGVASVVEKAGEEEKKGVPIRQ
ncbi:hypothetical protein B0A54_03188 [Friedmanniomyces endolithicus]|uniref:Uncharacterized protein n=1 Tax=Friedmanniomyces endolithicus TaxID=329885 RepID=A0A4U0V806_9PEZI|nr:hypothetical protein B0A54_03188 [Friedmanniomyces endolithicus]